MKGQIITLSAALAFFGLAATAEAGSGSPGRDGTISAYALSGEVYDSERCPRTKYSWNYVRCGKTLRARVKARMCRARGKGLHRYYYQVGDGRKSKSSVYCRAGDGARSSDDDRAEAGSGSPGRKGTIAAYSLDGDVYDSQKCPRTKYSWSYVSCGKMLRARVKARMCRARGKGLHRYYYQVGNGKRTKSSVYCRSGAASAGDHRDDERAGDDTGNGRPGRRGNVAAFFPDQDTLFDSQRCLERRIGYDYTVCGKQLRSRVKRRICSRRGKGLHRYYYQIGDKRKSKTSVYCKR